MMSDTYRRFVKLLTENFSREELELMYVENYETSVAIAQAIMSRKLADRGWTPLDEGEKNGSGNKAKT